VRDLPQEVVAGQPEGRQAAVLQALVETYLATGAPVGSRLLAETQLTGICSATVRNVFGDLVRSGYLTQPHTSAGRVPTTRAIRWWLQQLDAPAPTTDTAAAQELEHSLRAAGDETTLWLRASEFLSESSQQVGMVALAPWRDAGLKYLRFFRLTDRRVLVILVAADGQVRERVGRVPEAYTQAELDEASRFFNQHFSGATLARIQRELWHRLEEERAAYDALLKRVVVLSHCGVLEAQDGGEVFFQGASHLAGMLDTERLAAMLEQLQQKERWLRLLTGLDRDASDEWVEWTQGESGGEARCWLRVRVGLDDNLPELSLISANYGSGAIGILGSTRMEYQRALGAVTLVREVCRRVLGETTT
jgi:heat-inducible transcriptional repressor